MSTESQTEGDTAAADDTTGEKKSASTSTTKTEEEPQLITHKYDLNEKWWNVLVGSNSKNRH